MADQALENAVARRAALREEQARTAREINELAAVWERRQAELDQVERFIKMWHDMAGIPYADAGEQKKDEAGAEATRRFRPKNPPREAVAMRCVSYIREAERPLSRRELFERLEGDGVEIRGKDPEMVLSTMLWRSKDIIIRLKGGGYWPTGEPLPESFAGDLI
jgi:hypothetical protein